MSHQVHLDKSWALFVPIGEGAYWDGVFEKGAWLGGCATSPGQLAPGALQAAVDR